MLLFWKLWFYLHVCMVKRCTTILVLIFVEFAIISFNVKQSFQYLYMRFVWDFYLPLLKGGNSLKLKHDIVDFWFTKWKKHNPMRKLLGCIYLLRYQNYSVNSNQYDAQVVRRNTQCIRLFLLFSKCIFIPR